MGDAPFDQYVPGVAQVWPTDPVVPADAPLTEIPGSITGRPGAVAASLAAAVVALTKIRDLHIEPYPDAGYCQECEHNWPCQSRAAADDALGGA